VTLKVARTCLKSKKFFKTAIQLTQGKKIQGLSDKSLPELGSTQDPKKKNYPAQKLNFIFFFVAPELLNNENISEASDVWSIGVLAALL
jgi:hypothetical protein